MARQVTEGWMKEMIHELDFHREVLVVTRIRCTWSNLFLVF